MQCISCGQDANYFSATISFKNFGVPIIHSVQMRTYHQYDIDIAEFCSELSSSSNLSGQISKRPKLIDYAESYLNLLKLSQPFMEQISEQSNNTDQTNSGESTNFSQISPVSQINNLIESVKKIGDVQITKTKLWPIANFENSNLVYETEEYSISLVFYCEADKHEHSFIRSRGYCLLCDDVATRLYGHSDELLSTSNASILAFCDKHKTINSLHVGVYNLSCSVQPCQSRVVVKEDRKHYCAQHSSLSMITYDFRLRQICQKCGITEPELYTNDVRKLFPSLCIKCKEPGEDVNMIQPVFSFGYDRLGYYIKNGNMPDSTGPAQTIYTEQQVERATQNCRIKEGTNDYNRYLTLDQIRTMMRAYNAR